MIGTALGIGVITGGVLAYKGAKGQARAAELRLAIAKPSVDAPQQSASPRAVSLGEGSIHPTCGTQIALRDWCLASWHNSQRKRNQGGSNGSIPISNRPGHYL